MSRTPWTPGPWSEQVSEGLIVYIYSNAGLCICEVTSICEPNAERGSTLGNANLIAMAPDFATEAQTLVDWWDDDNVEKPALPYEVGHALIRLRHILKMARGET